jgi:molybdate transport system ATP-binding protein
MATLDLHLHSGLRAFALDVELTLGAETLALAGPSGAGKTTVLRMVAGLARPERGRILAGEDAWLDTGRGVDLRPERRAVGLVPQEYALFPHLSVEENVGFADPARAAELMARFGIAHLAGERPARLSGGERQRVALARALARQPKVLLLDEPLAALDAQTRRRVRDELGEMLRELAIPTLMVTHDIGDAAALADRVAVLVDGRVRQVGSPGDLYAEPADAFVAAFTGANVLAGVARSVDGGCVVALDDGGELGSVFAVDGRVAVAFQPWEVALRGGGAGTSGGEGAGLGARGGGGEGGDGAGPHLGHGAIRARVSSVTPLGPRSRVHAGPFVAEVEGEPFLRGDEVVVSVDPERVRPLPL